MEPVTNKAAIFEWSELQLDGVLPTFQFCSGYPCPHKSLADVRGKSIDCVLELCSLASSSSTDLQVLEKSELYEALDQEFMFSDEAAPPSPSSPADGQASYMCLSEAALHFQSHATTSSAPYHSLPALDSATPRPQHLAQANLSPLASAVLAGWESKSDLLRYDVSQCPTRVIPGSLGFIAQLNEGRATKKRPTEVKVDKVCQPWDATKFNFTKARVGEALVQFEEACSCGHVMHAQHKAAPCLGTGSCRGLRATCSSHSNSSDIGGCCVEAEEAQSEESCLRADSSDSGSDCPPLQSVSEPNSSLTPPFTNSAAPSASSALSLVLVNVSPIDYGHVLLVPNILQCQPQLITTESMLCGLHFARQLNHQHMRVGYNSLGAFATINHLHFQAYYLEHTLPCERAPTQPLRLSSGMDPAAGSGMSVHSLAQYPVRGFVVELGPKPDKMTLLSAAHLLGRACARMQAADLPFNLLITNCGERVFVWPQRYAARQAAGLVDEEWLECGVNPAAFEIAGHLVLKRAEDYEKADEAWAWRLLEGVSLTDAEFQATASLCWK